MGGGKGRETVTVTRWERVETRTRMLAMETEKNNSRSILLVKAPKLGGGLGRLRIM